MIKYAYNNNRHVFIKVLSFFLMYNYNLKIHYKRSSSVTLRFKKLTNEASYRRCCLANEVL